MQRRLRPIAVLVAAGWLALSGSLTATAPSGKPEDVGLSTKRLERVGELVQRHLASGSFSGAVTLVARNGRIVHHEAFGVMDLETKKPMPKDGIFRIMSMTKPVVGVATLMMIEEGTIRLTDPVSKFIPEWKDMTVGVAMAGGRGGAPEPRYYTVPVEREITIRDLLTHTNGVVSGPISQSANRAVAAKPTETLADYIPRLGRVPTEFQPGTRWAYSATAAWDTLSRIVEIVSGMPMDRFVKTRIFDPLEMKDTTYVEPIGNPRLVKLYSRTPEGLRPAPTPAFMNGVYFSGGGGLLSTATDYAQFALMLANGGELNGVRLLSPRSVALMGSVFVSDTLPGRPRGESFGLSVRVVTDPATRNTFLSEGSYGWSGAFGTHFWVDPKEKLIAIALTQTSSQEFLRDFENMVMQAVVGGTPRTAGTN
jgi:CubicO group peptidase (beta-lactamase class C family)